MPHWKTQYLNKLTIYNIYIQKYKKAPKQEWYGHDGTIANILRDTGIANKYTIIDVLEKQLILVNLQYTGKKENSKENI